MVCQRCKMVVSAELKKIGLHPVSVSLGEVVLQEPVISPEKKIEIESQLKNAGFELLDDKKSKLIEQIKNFIIETIHYKDEPPQKNYSDLLSQLLHHDYSYLSSLFSAVEGITIEQYVINQKIEKVKELLIYDELSLSQIAFQLGYSSTAHLSAQFKKVTGFTPSLFKKAGKRDRIPLDAVGKRE